MKKINLLFLEDEEMDVFLVKRILERSGLDFTITTATNKREFLEAIAQNTFDVILADNSLPQFSAMDALQLAKESNVSKPFILVTGTVSEEFAVSAMKDGAWDYILKDRMQRLPAAITGAMEKYMLETERNRSYNKLKESEGKYRHLFENNPVPMWVLDSSTLQILDVNEAAINMYGYSREEFLSMTTVDIRPDDEKARYLSLTRTGAGGINNNGVWKHLKKDGTIIFVEVSSENIVFEGRDARIILINNITEKKLAEESLRKSEANLLTIFKNTVTGYVLLDTATRVLSFNQPAVDFVTGHLHKTLKEGTFAIDYFSENRRDHIRTNLENALSGQHCSYEIKYPPAAGTDDKWFNAGYYPVWDNEKNVLGVVMAITDISERKLSELQEKKITAELLQRNVDLEQFAYIISHNLRAPVANIIGISSALIEGNLDEADTKEFMEGLNSSIHRLDTVIIDLNHILQVKHKISEHREKVLLSQLVNDIKFSVSNFSGTDMVMIVSDFEEIDEISTLKSYIHSIFYNLISNSIKYRQPGVAPVIEIKSYKTTNKIAITFKDNSMGIDLETKGDQVFGLYKRFHTQSAEGKGMGLFMVKTQVETLGGKISVTSKVNEGSEFRIEFESIDDLLN